MVPHAIVFFFSEGYTHTLILFLSRLAHAVELYAHSRVVRMDGSKVVGRRIGTTRDRKEGDDDKMLLEKEVKELKKKGRRW